MKWIIHKMIRNRCHKLHLVELVMCETIMQGFYLFFIFYYCDTIYAQAKKKKQDTIYASHDELLQFFQCQQ